MYRTAKGTQLLLSGGATAWSPTRSGNLLTGTAGNDVFFENSGDVAAGGAGDDEYNTWSTDTKIIEAAGGGIDTLRWFAYGPAILPDNVENLFLSGDGALYGKGNALANVIGASAAGSFLDGGAGDDILIGGAGSDTFNIEVGKGSDAIENFQAGKDLVRLSGYDIANFAALKPLMSQVGADVSIALGHGEIVMLRNVDLASLSAADFRLANPVSTVVPPPASGTGVSLLNGAAQVYIANGWAILNNTWNSGSLTYGKDYTVATTYHKSDLTGGTTFSWTYPTVATTPGMGGTILAYPEVSFGVNPYGSGTNSTDKAAVFPAQVGTITNLTAHYDLSIKGASAGFNVAFDMWFTSKPNGNASTITNEVMIWLHQGDFDAYGQRVGTYTDGAFSATIYYNAATHYTAIVANSDALIGDLDISKIMVKLQDLGILSKTEYLASVELGAEVVSGAGSLAVNNLDLDLTTYNAADSTLVTKTVTGSGTTVTTHAAPPPTIEGTAGDDSLIGTALNDIINGGAGNDLLDGKAGADKMTGGTGNDVYIVDAVGDTVVEAKDGGTDTVNASVSYTLSAFVENLTLTGSAAIDAAGNDLNNVLTGNDADNVLDGRTGADTMIGGGGNDTYVVDNAGDVVRELAGGGIDTVKAAISYKLGDAVDNLTLTGTDAINGTGNALANIIIGNGANNVLDGAGGADTLIGGAGDDMYIIRSGNEQVVEAVGGGKDNVYAAVSYVLAAGQEIEQMQAATGTAAINLTGNEFANYFFGNAGNNVFDGGAGNDTLDGNGGLDTLIGGKGNDTFIVRNGLETIIEEVGGGKDQVLTMANFTLGAGQEIETLAVRDVTSLASYHLGGNEFDNAIYGASGNDTIDGGAGNDYLSGGAGNDTLIGGTGNDLLVNDLGVDTLIGGGGDDVFRVSNAATVVIEGLGGGKDNVTASVSYRLGAGQEIETLQAAAGTAAIDLTGNEFNNNVFGNAGANTLDGGAGNDVLEGGAGADRLRGGFGCDMFVFREGDTGRTSATADTILDFSHAQGDKIDLSRIDANTALAGDQSFTIHQSGADHVAGALWMTVVDGLTVINLDTNGDGIPDYMINVMSTGTVTSGDFIF